MKTKIINFWESVRESYWFVPGLMLIGAVVSANAALVADAYWDLAKIRGFGWAVFSNSEGARAVLLAIASSTLTAATVTFSVTMVTLSSTSSQFGPRLLHNFLRDPLNQFVLGAFIGTFVYSLMVMRGLVVNGDRIPNIAVTTSVFFVLVDALLFIVFIHHVTASIRIENLSATTGEEFIRSIYRLFPNPDRGEFKKSYPNEPPGFDPGIVTGEKHGYIQAISFESLKTVAMEAGITIELLYKPGHFLIPGAPIANVRPKMLLTASICEQIGASFLVGVQPTSEQDVEFAVRQLVQIAARALSPGINDPFTAMTCIDYLSTGLAIVGKRELPDPYVRDDSGKILVIQRCATFGGICEACFQIIRQMSVNNPPVAIHLLESLIRLASIVSRQKDKRTLLKIGKRTADSSIRECSTAHDRCAIKQRYENLKAGLRSNTSRGVK